MFKFNNFGRFSVYFVEGFVNELVDNGETFRCDSEVEVDLFENSMEGFFEWEAKG